MVKYKIIELYQSPQYHYINGFKQYYINYHNHKNWSGHSRKNPVNDFQKLIDNFDENKMKQIEVVLENDKYVIIDGLHRCSILYSKNKDREIKVKVIKNDNFNKLPLKNLKIKHLDKLNELLVKIKDKELRQLFKPLLEKTIEVFRKELPKDPAKLPPFELELEDEQTWKTNRANKQASRIQSIAKQYEVRRFINKAIANNVIDGTKSFPEFRQYMIEEFGLDEEAETETYKTISYNEYADQMEDDFSDSENEIAIITAEGAIMEGEITQGVAGSSGVVKQIRSAHENENTKAIVFRVNSPGGSIIASEMMRDELLAAKRKGINVVVSMGDYAASGGVYISTPADYIFAEPTTITGSIGVAFAFPTLENAMDYIGVNFDGVVTSKHGGWDLTQGIDDDLDKIFARWGADAYDRFIKFVAESRSKSYEDIKEIAGGRVWIATSASEIGLVDAIGGIDDAITYAADMAALEDYRVEYYGEELSPREKILKELLKNSGVSLGESKVLSALDGLANLYEKLRGIKEPKALLTCMGCLVDLD